MTILITGAGMIGRLTAAQLRAGGRPVLLTDVRRPSDAQLDGMPFERCDVTDFDRLDGLIAAYGVTAIVHTAALLSTAIRRDPLAGVQVNTMGTANVLEAARCRGVSRVVIASSTTVMYAAFASLPPIPIAEDFPYRIVSERPTSLYAVTKVASEHLALAYASLYGLDVIVLRYGAVLGAGPEAATSVPGQLLMRLLQAGRDGVAVHLDDPILLWRGKEEFVDARDCAAANVAALDAAAPVLRVYNVATGDWFALDAFIDAVRQHYPALRVASMSMPAGGFAAFPHCRPAPSSVEAARRELGFATQYTLDATIAHFAAALE